MLILRHLDKAIFALLCALTVFYAAVSLRSHARRAEERANTLVQAQQLLAETERIEVPPPPEDPARFADAVRAQWGDIPGELRVGVDARHFYPRARPRE